MNIFTRKFPSEFIRGGRLRRTSKGLVSFAPFLAGASALALGALLATTPPAEAGTCTETGRTGEWTCTGAEDANGGEQEQTITGRANQNTSVIGDATFGFNSSRGGWLTINSRSTTGAIDVDLSNGNNITSHHTPIIITQDGPGAVTVTTDGTLTSTDTASDGSSGIRIRQNGAGPVTVMSSGTISATGRGIHIGTHANTTGEIRITANDITSGNNGNNNDGIYVDQKGTGAVIVETTGTLTSSSGRLIHVATDAVTTGDVTITTRGNLTTSATGLPGAGIEVNQVGTGGVTVRAYGTIDVPQTNALAGIYIETTKGSTIGNVEITTGADATIRGIQGIHVNNNGTGDVTITTNGEINANRGVFVRAYGQGNDARTEDGGNVVITVNNNITARTGLDLNNPGSGGITVYVNALIESMDASIREASVNAIRINGGDGDHRIVFGDGGRIGGDDQIIFNADAASRTVEFTGTGDNRFPLIADRFQLVDEIVKSGAGTWTLDGFQGTGSTKTIAVHSGRLVLDIDNTGGDNTFFFTNDSPGVTVADGATLEVTSPLVFDAYIPPSGDPAGAEDVPMTLAGILQLTGADSSLALDTLTGMDGTINIDVDFSGGTAELDAPRISAASATGSTTVNIRSVGELPRRSEDEMIDIGNLIKITGTADANAFVAGSPLNRGFRFGLVHNEVGGENIWTLAAEIIALGIEEALYESLPATLVQLAGVESYRQRLQGRRHNGNRGLWAKVSSAAAEFEPANTTLAMYETGNTVTEFGMNAPLRINACIPGSCTVSASVAFGEASADVAVEGDTGEIETGSVQTAISANWEHGGAYMGGQLQYAVFRNEIKAGAKLANESASACSAGVEVGLGLNIADFRVVPSAQLLWTSVDFGSFTDFAGTRVELNDGSVLAGRTGVGAEYDRGGVLLRGHADVLIPVDGEVGTRVDGMELISEREDPVVDIGIGATYAWGDAYALSADISALQGGEVEGYAGSIGFKYKFQASEN